MCHSFQELNVMVPGDWELDGIALGGQLGYFGQLTSFAVRSITSFKSRDVLVPGDWELDGIVHGNLVADGFSSGDHERMEPVNNEEQVTVDIDSNEIPVAADDDSVTNEPTDARFRIFTDNGMMKSEETTNNYNVVKDSFLLGMGTLAEETLIVAIHKNKSSTVTGEARLSSFQIFQEAMARKFPSGDANVRYAWYGVAKDEIREILCHGFSRIGKAAGNGEKYGHGLHLSNSNFSIDSVLSSEIDENGLRHVLLCRVILGNVETVPAGSNQFYPSVKDYDSGVDNLALPSRYMVWSCSMNSHIYFTDIVSFKFPCYEEASASTSAPPSSPLLRISTIVKIFSMYLDPLKMTLIYGFHNDLQAQRISWNDFLQKVMEVSGVKLFDTRQHTLFTPPNFTMDPGNRGEQVTIDINYDEIPEADESNSDLDARFRFFTDNGMFKTDEASNDYNAVKNSFLFGMGLLADQTRIVCIHKNLSSSLTGKARLNSFKIFQEAMARKCSGSGDANVRCAWYGAAKDEVREILRHGFSRLDKAAGNGETYGHGVHLSNSKFSMDSVLSSEMDENGLRHVLLCRVILGKMETVPSGSNQFHPSVKDYDSGVDNLAAPRRYIVWGCSMNSHILLSHVVSFRFPCYEGSTGSTVPSSLLRVSTIIKILPIFLDPPEMALIYGFINDHQANRIPWSEFKQKVAEVSGGKLFSNILKLRGHD
ncbi:hypothetical protein EZV62_017607 [Acer yangbiense]|uniref:Poly [ADP-ribose] polymerase n=1 Tax=Acer yangbiense TaxID=1000413 RepID=A0A5C7HHD5_9ROSI|nr:hypothetical protein EZV62_017607 [Acer yangbiense]